VRQGRQGDGWLLRRPQRQRPGTAGQGTAQGDRRRGAPDARPDAADALDGRLLPVRPGQVLNAVVPAGAREQAGSRSLVFLEAVPEAELPQPLPPLTAKQTAALTQLRSAGKASEVRQLARQVHCGPGPLDALVEKGFARRTVRRVDRFRDSTEE